MSWFKVDDQSAFHAKVVAAGNAAWGALVRMGAHCANHGTDGLVSKDIAHVIGSSEEIARLLATGLLEQVEGGYLIHDYLEWNISAEQARKLRNKRAKAGKAGGIKSAAKRQASASANIEASAVATHNQRDLGLDPVQGSLSQGELERESGTIRTPTNATDDGCFGMAVQAWTDGLRLARGTPVTRLEPGEVRKLLRAFQAHAPAHPSEREVWARDMGGRYGRYVGPGGEASPWGFARWLDAGAPASRGPAKAPVQGVPATGRLWKVGKS